MKKKFMLQMKEQLLEQKAEIFKQIQSSIDVDVDGDETDEIQGNMLIQLTNKLNIRNAAKLNQIETALKSIEDGTYGLCIDCDEEIAEKRLISNPYFQTCVSCAEDRENEEKQRKRP